MWDFIKHTGQVIYDGIVGGVAFVLAARFFNKRIMNSTSILYYKRPIEWLQIRYYILKLFIVVTLFTFLRRIGLMRPINKETETKLAIGIAMVVLIFIFAVIIQGQQKRKALS